MRTLKVKNCQQLEKKGSWIKVLTKDNKTLHINTNTKTITKNNYMRLIQITKSI